MKTMETYCASCKKNPANESSNGRKTTSNRITLLSNCAICDQKKLAFIKNQVFNNISND